jgi:formylmethanofuran dehydrogenase subunit E
MPVLGNNKNLKGALVMCLEKSEWEKCAEFHGHVCPGLAIGYRAAKIGLQELAGSRAKNEELVVIAETDACGVDAVMVITGCTLGKGNLLYRNFGKHAFTFINRSTGECVRICAHSEAWQQDEQMRLLRAKVFAGSATDEEKSLIALNQRKIMQQILDMPQEEFCKVQHVKEELPPKARIFDSVTCAFCGEMVSESRTRIRDGKPACIPCSGKYTRGW